MQIIKYGLRRIYLNPINVRDMIYCTSIRDYQMCNLYLFVNIYLILFLFANFK